MTNPVNDKESQLNTKDIGEKNVKITLINIIAN